MNLNSNLKYINHPQSVKRNLIRDISKTIPCISSNVDIFNSHKDKYDKEITKVGYRDKPRYFPYAREVNNINNEYINLNIIAYDHILNRCKNA